MNWKHIANAAILCLVFYYCEEIADALEETRIALIGDFKVHL